MAEAIGTIQVNQAARAPAANTWKKLAIITGAGASVTLEAGNGTVTDALIDVAIMDPTDGAAFSDGGTPPAYSVIHGKILIESDGNSWSMPVKNLEVGAVIGIRTSVVGVNFLCHGFTFS